MARKSTEPYWAGVMARRLIIVTPPISQQTKRSAKNGSRITRQPKIAGTTAKMHDYKPFPWRPIMRIFVAAVVVALIVGGMNSSIFAVRHITIQGLKNVQEADVLAKLPTKGNVWFYPVKANASSLKKVSPYIADVGIYRSLPDTIRVIVAERVLALDWQTNDHQYIIGLDGTVIAQTAPPSDMVKVIDTTNLQPNVGQAVATPGFVHFASELYTKFPGVMNDQIDHLEISDTTFDVTIVPKSNPKILVDSTRDPQTQLGSAKLVIDQFHDKIKQYVDVRVPGKAYFQ